MTLTGSARQRLRRDVLLTGCAGLWFLQAFVPWTSTGLLSQSSTLDAATLIRSGAVDELVPGWAYWLLLTLPLCAVALLISLPFRRREADLLRVVFLLVGIASTAVLTVVLSFELSRTGPGALLSWLGLVAALPLLGGQAPPHHLTPHGD